MDLVIGNATVITMNGRREVLRDAELVIQGNRIAKVGKPRRGIKKGVARYIDARGKVVLPGLIHSHLHACQTLCRNHADGRELLDWLKERIWPFEAAHDAQSLRASADLTFLECIRSGATSVLDMGTVRHYDSVFESARASGIRLVGGKCMMDVGEGVPKGLLETTASSLSESIRLIETWHGSENDRLRYALAPRFVLSCTEGLLREVAQLAKARGVRIHTHASENPTECQVVREVTGKDNIVYFDHVGLLGAHTTLAHCVHLSEAELKLLVKTSTSVAHCPSANFKLASGIARVPELLNAKVNVGLGADGAPCNNNLDIFVELRQAALIHLPRMGPTSLSALQALEMATLNGAKALGLEGEVGVLQEGARADVITVDLSGAHATPNSSDPVATLVYAGQSRDVRDVVVDGQVLMRDRGLMTMDDAAIRASATAHSARLMKKLKS